MFATKQKKRIADLERQLLEAQERIQQLEEWNDYWRLLANEVVRRHVSR